MDRISLPIAAIFNVWDELPLNEMANFLNGVVANVSIPLDPMIDEWDGFDRYGIVYNRLVSF